MSDAYTKITLDVIKRNGKKVSFDASKIALAIKKGFDNVVILEFHHITFLLFDCLAICRTRVAALPCPAARLQD